MNAQLGSIVQNLHEISTKRQVSFVKLVPTVPNAIDRPHFHPSLLNARLFVSNRSVSVGFHLHLFPTSVQRANLPRYDKLGVRPRLMKHSHSQSVENFYVINCITISNQ